LNRLPFEETKERKEMDMKGRAKKTGCAVIKLGGRF
jgi:hypothetical protein